MNTFNLKLNFPNLLWEIAGYNFPSLFGKRAILFIFIAISFQVSAQRMAIKTNTLEWLAASPNLGVEFPLNDWMTAEISASSTMRLSSRIQAKERLRQMQSVLYLLGGGIAVLLGFVGLLNFVNILSASIVRRKVEFAILESIGMTKRQLRQQVIYEGASYAIIAILLFSTLGTTLTLILLNVFSSQVSYALCRYPVLPTLLIVIALILLSAVIPTILFQCSRKTSLIDRLRSVE